MQSWPGCHIEAEAGMSRAIDHDAEQVPQDATSVASATGHPEESKSPAGRPLVLVADDQPAMRTFLRTALEHEGFETIEAIDGRDALAQILQYDVAALVMDVQMPVLDGLGALREIRADSRSRTLPVILVTASHGESDRIRGLESGADDLLAKPVAVKELAARVRAQIRAKAAWTRELERGREHRRRLAAAIEELPRDVPLEMLATSLVERLPLVLDVDGAAILHFSRGAVRTVAASRALRSKFRPTQPLPAEIGDELASRAAAGAWLDAPIGSAGSNARAMDLAYVPFQLGASTSPLGCLVFSQRRGRPAGPLSHRLADLIDATDFIVALLRPAVEQAETQDAAITRLQKVISLREFAIHLQPIVRLSSGDVVAAEALTRFTDGLPPDVRFAEAASLGLGLPMQRETLAAAIEAAKTLPPAVALSVNLSADVLQHEPALAAILGAAGRPLIVELTEHERIDDYAAVRSALRRLGRDVRLAIDDAGSGYASLRHILALQPAYVKLDIEWVSGIDRDPVRRALVSGLAYFATETGCELIAEGIETAEELEALHGLGVQLGQGYLLGRPMPPVISGGAT
jgi:EAL domain-containing protein (putative c-di-GMP-specific phosphodiesterase class I)/DNA-binding NarL/FixJ family response regulator